MDPTNDARIQHVLENEVGGTIVLTIAHRLRTVLGNDRILVMDNGRTAQFDTPHELLKNPGIFHDLACDAGITIENVLLGKSTNGYRGEQRELGPAARLENKLPGPAAPLLAAQAEKHEPEPLTSLPVRSTAARRALSQSLCLQGICLELQ